VVYTRLQILPKKITAESTPTQPGGKDFVCYFFNPVL
jgi:hypothetical protein